MKIKANQLYMVLAAAIALALFYYFFIRKATSGFQDGDTFTLYYASWCPHCKDVKPVFEKWMKDNGGSIQANGKKINLALIEESDIPAGADVKGFPTMKLNNKEYSGARTPEAWKAWIQANA